MQITVDEALTKNLVGRLNSATVVKTTMNNAVTAIHRAAGIEIPSEQSLPILKEQRRSKIADRPKVDMIPGSTPTSRQPTHSPGFIRSDAPVPESDAESVEDGFELELSTIKSRSASPEPRKRTTFLPALSSGYIPASDSSDPDEEYNSFAPLKKERKNRRGQRERQAIWLKKYGSSARHLHPELKKTDPPKAMGIRERKSHDGEKPSDAPVVMEVVKKVNDPHPSWIAKQKIREQQKAVMSSVKPQKIVFN
jgi:BUD22